VHVKFVRSSARQRDETRRKGLRTDLSFAMCARVYVATCVCSRRERVDKPAATVKETRVRGRVERGNAGAAGVVWMQ